MHATKLRKVGGSLGVTLPKEIIARLRIKEGEDLHIIETQDGVVLTPYDPEFEATMQTFEESRHENRTVLRELAKR